MVALLHVAVRMLDENPLSLVDMIPSRVKDVVKLPETELVRKVPLWIWSVVCILAIELMIKWNHIDGVNNISTVGQVIPFFVGFGSLVTVFTGWDYKAWKATGARNDEFAQVVVLLLITALVLGVVVCVLAAVGKVLQP